MIYLQHFVLKQYNGENKEDQRRVEELKNDIKIRRYVGEQLLQEYLNECFYLVYNQNNFIGFISIFDSIEKEKQLAYGILSKYRKQKYGTLLLSEFSDYLLNRKKQYELLHIWVERENFPSIRAAKHSGYEKETDYLYIKRKNI